MRQERTLQVTVPAGIDSGQRIALEGQEESGPRGGPPGDLYVVVTVRDHRISSGAAPSCTTSCRSPSRRPRWGHRCRSRPWRAPRSSPCRPARSRAPSCALGRGVPKLRGSGRGDLHVIVTVVIPEKLNKSERDLLKQLNEVAAPAVLPNSGGPGLFDRLRDIFS